MGRKLLLLLFIIGLLSACSKPVATASTGNTEVAINVPDGMVRIAPGVQVESAMSETDRKRLLQDIEVSRQQIARFFGGAMQSTPEIFACATDACMQSFGGVDAEAKSLGRSSIILSRRGCNPTIITHEMVHIELHHRLGRQVNLHKLPMWFDEGLAVLACNDPRFRASPFMRPPSSSIDIDQLVTERQWLDAVYARKNPYQVAKDAVEKWHRKEGVNGLLKLIETIRKTGEFPEILNARQDSNEGLVAQ